MEYSENDMSLFTLVKHLIYGMIGVNVVLFITGLISGSYHFSIGVSLGAVSGFLNLWSYFEQGKKIEKIISENPESKKVARMFFFRYALNAAFLGICGFLSVQMLIGCFCGIMSLRLSIYIVTFFNKLKRG